MTRPGFVLEVDDRTPPLVVHEGEGFRLENFPLGTRVIYPPESLPSVPDVDTAIRDALLNPVDADPLPTQLHAGMKLTIAFDDLSIPLPPMRAPDIRQRIIEQVLTMAADAGVDDVHIIAANALHRRMTAGRAQAHRRRAGLPVVLSAGAALQPRRRGPRQPAPHRADRQGRGHRDQPACGRVRPAGLRERQPRRHGRRAQVGADRPGVVQVAQAPPQREDDGAVALVHGPHQVAPPPLRVADGPAPQGAPQHLPDRDHARQQRVPGAVRLLDEARVGVVGQGPGLDARRAARACRWRRSGCATRSSTTCGRRTA